MPSLIKQLKWFLVDQFMFHVSSGGGGGSPAPVQQNVSNTNIPSYAQPYVENMLGQTAALTDINQNPYQTYGGERIAEFSPLQQQAFGNVASQTTAGQIDTGTGLSTASGVGSLGTTQQAGGYGGLGAGYGAMAAGMAPQAQGYGALGAGYGAGATNLGLSAADMAAQQGLGYGAIGAGYGAQAAGMAPQAQMLGRMGTQIGMGGLGYGAQGMQAGQQAAGYGAQGANIGQNVAGMSTDPGSQAAYMSPYIQNALQPQLAEMNRQYAITGAQEQGRATASGAFGGSRNALMQSENARNKNQAMNLAIGQGYQSAFQNAQNQMNQAAQLGMQGTQQGITGQQAAMQGAGVGLSGISSALQGQQAGLQGLNQASQLYGQGMQGAQTGLQGLQGALAGTSQGLQGYQTGMQGAQTGLQGLQQAGNLYGQGMTGAQVGLQGVGAQQAGYAGANQAAGTLGQLGQTEFGQQQAINTSQQTTGAVQQAQAQQALDQQYQDFMKQKNYPYQQLAFMADMTRGLPLSQTANTMYSAPPNAASQLGGLGMSALGIYGMSGGFGTPARANGGVVKAATGGLMAANRYKEGGYADGGQPMAGADVIKQLTQMLDNPELSPQEVEAIEKKIMLYQRMLGNPQAESIIAPQPDQRSGIAAIGTGEMVPQEGMAGGGIVAFAQGGKPPEITSYQDMLRQSVEKKLKGLEDNTVDPFSESKAREADIQSQLGVIRQRSPYEALAMAGLGTMAGTSQYGLSNLGLGGIQGLQSYAKSKAEADQLNKLLLTQGVEREKSKYARDMGSLNAQMTELGRMDTKEIGLKNAANVAGATAESRNERLRLQAATLWKDTTHDIATELKDQAKFNSLYRKNPSAFNDLVEQEAKKRMDPKTLELLGKTPAQAAVVNPAAPAPSAAPRSYPPASAAAISALKSSKDPNAPKQFDAIFGPGAAQTALGQ